MLNILNSTIFCDPVIYLCVPLLVFLLWNYCKTKDKELIFFILADVFYLLGEICWYILHSVWGIPVDFIFFLLFYCFMFLYLRRRTKTLLKNPMATQNTEIITWILISLDFIIIAVISYLIYYFFDRASPSYQITFSNLTPSVIINFIYPFIDLLLLGYYININKLYIVHDKKVYLPVTVGVSIWTVSDFLLAYEEMFKAQINGIGDYLQLTGIILLIILLVMIKSNKADSYYTTIDLNRNISKLGSYNLLINVMIVLYVAVYIYCLCFANSYSSRNTVNEAGIVMLLFALIRQNIINLDTQNKLTAMSKEASTDPLTGLFSRKYAFSLIHSLYRSSQYFNMDISVLMLDLDYFKNYNDTYGHVSGDLVLQEIAGLMRRSIESSNVICRYGGEEFLIVLPGTKQAEGMLVAEKIRKNIEAYDFHEGKQPSGKLTVSIGGATAGSKTKNEFDLIKQADVALYKAKEERNKCSWFEIVV